MFPQIFTGQPGAVVVGSGADGRGRRIGRRTMRYHRAVNGDGVTGALSGAGGGAAGNKYNAPGANIYGTRGLPSQVKGAGFRVQS